MIRRLLLSAVLFLAATPLLADETITFTNSTDAYVDPDTGFSISPYVGTLNGQTTDFFCVDFSHNFGVPADGSTTWTATATLLDSSSSFLGTLQYTPTSTNATAYNNYLEMAWLITQLQASLNAANVAASVGDTSAEAADLQAASEDQLAIWTFTGYTDNYYGTDETLLQDAQNAVNNGFTAPGWEILTPDFATYPNSQEMIVMPTPESGTLILLLAGLSTLLTFSFLRKP